jgi:predicted enzyme related to lactoylglutathione lyase
MASPFCWYELMTSDTAAAGKFYADVVGWTTEAGQGDMAFYTMLLTPAGPPVGGMMGITPEMAAQGGRPGWVGYVAVDDVDASTAKAAELGGTVHRQPGDIPGVGRFSVLADPYGAVFMLFRADPGYAMPPAGDGSGFVGWRELMAGDLEGAWAFYSALFGWTKDTDHDMGPMGAYRLFKTGGDKQVGGMMTKPDTLPASFWTYYFIVDGIRAATDRLTKGGGQVMNGPMQVPGGDWIVQAMDPQGGMFALTSRTE